MASEANGLGARGAHPYLENEMKYRVVVTRDITESAVVEVETDNFDIVDELAQEKAFKEGRWVYDDNLLRASDGYVTDVEELK